MKKLTKKLTILQKAGGHPQQSRLFNIQSTILEKVTALKSFHYVYYIYIIMFLHSNYVQNKQFQQIYP